MTGVSSSVASVPSEDDSRINTHSQQFTPGPKRKVFAVTSPALLKFFRRLPVLLFTEQLFIRNSAARFQELTDIFQRAALHSQRLTYIPTHRKSRTRSLAVQKGLGDLPADRVVGLWNDLGDHETTRFSHEESAIGQQNGVGLARPVQPRSRRSLSEPGPIARTSSASRRKDCSLPRDGRILALPRA